MYPPSLPTEPHNPPKLLKIYSNTLNLNNDATHICFYEISVHGISASENYAKGKCLTEALALLQVDV